MCCARCCLRHLATVALFSSCLIIQLVVQISSVGAGQHNSKDLCFILRNFSTARVSSAGMYERLWNCRSWTASVIERTWQNLVQGKWNKSACVPRTLQTRAGEQWIRLDNTSQTVSDVPTKVNSRGTNRLSIDGTPEELVGEFSCSKEQSRELHMETPTGV